MSKIKDLLARAISLASEQPMSYKEVIELLDGIDTCKVKIWLEEGAKLPEYAHKEDACMDLFVKDIELDGGRTGEARKDEVSLLPLGLHYPYRYSIVTMRTFPIGIRFTSRTKISYYTIIV